MKRLSLLTLCLFLGLLRPAEATCNVGALPFQLQNNTTADATQVMADFNQIVNGVLANCAAAGANNDITSLGALSTPLTPVQGGTTVFNGGFASGTNALTITTTPSFSLVTGYRVSFIAAATSTTNQTANVSGTGTKNIFRRTQSGAQLTQGGELISGTPYTMVWDGTEFVLDGEMVVIGEMRDYAGGAVIPGFILADGTNYTTATFPQLFAVIGTSYGGTAGNFNVPDTRGRVLAGLDNYGSGTGAANRLTSGATGCGSAFTSVGAACANGSQNHVQALVEMATHNHTASSTDSGHGHNITDPGHVHGLNNLLNPTGGATVAGGAAGITVVTATNSATTGITINTGFANITTTTGNNGSSQAMPIVNPNLGVLKIIRF